MQVGMNRHQLAQKLRHNWATRDTELDVKPTFGDADLTNLGWLQNMDLMKLTPPTPPASPPASPRPLLLLPPPQLPMPYVAMHSPGSELQQHEQQQVDQQKRNAAFLANRAFFMPASSSATSSLADGLIQLPQTVPPSPAPEFASDPGLKPPYSFSTLIFMALTSLTRSRMTLQEICSWIGDKFAFYRCSSDRSWQSAVRYNLTLNRCFQRVPRRKDEAGNKGGYWRLNPDHASYLELPHSNHLATGAVSTAAAPLPLAAGAKRPATAPQRVASASREVAAAKRRNHGNYDGYLHGNQLAMHAAYQSQLSLPDYQHQQQQQQQRLPYHQHQMLQRQSSDWLNAGILEENATRTHDPTLSGVSLTNSAPDCSAAVTSASSTGFSSSASAAPGLDDERWLFEPDEGLLEGSQPALDMSNPASLLDLTLHGTALNPPSWWVGSIGEAATVGGGGGGGRGTTPSPILHHDQEEWVDGNLDANELDTLLGLA